MNPTVKKLLKILLAVVIYGAVFALAAISLSKLMNGDSGVWYLIGLIFLIIVGFFGFRATRGMGVSIFTGGPGGMGLFMTFVSFFLKIAVSLLAGLFIAPWKIAQKLVSLIPE